MALYKDPLDAVFAAIQAQNGVALVRDEYTLSTPTVYEDDPTGVLNTQIVVTAATPRSPYEGSVAVQYTRLNLADLAHLLPQPIRANGITTIANVITALNTNHGMNFQASDLVQGPVTGLVDGAGDITLTAEANSYGWIGEVTLSFVKGSIDIATATTVKNLPGLMYPARDESKPYGELYSYWRDFTPQTTALDAITLETTDFTTLAAALTAVTGNAWSANVAGRYSLLGATIAAVGLTADNPLTNPDYLKAVVVTLGEGSLGYSGQLILHYGTRTDV